MLQPYYLLFKTLHIVGFTAWFAGLFYLVRMFVYHVESDGFEEPKKSILSDQYGIMESRVYKIICNPAMMFTWFCGILMLVNNGFEWFKLNHWLHAKIVLLVLLTVYHLWCKRIGIQLRKGERPYSSFYFRLLNEVPTVFLVLIVLLAVFRNGLNWTYTLVGLAIFIGMMYRGAVAYKKRRLQNKS